MKDYLKAGVWIAVVTAIVFGLYPPAARAAYEDGGNAVFLMILTTFLRAVFLSLFCLVRRKTLFVSAQDGKTALVGGFFQALSILGIFSALTFLPGPLVIVIVFTHTLMLLFLMAWRGEVQLDSFTIATAAVALAGLVFVLDVAGHLETGDSVRTHGFLLGIGLSFLAAVATLVRSYLFGQLVATRNPAIVGAESFIVATLFLLPVAMFSPPEFPQTATGFFWTGVACASMVLGGFGMFYGIKALGSFKFSLFLKLEPVFNALFSVVFVHEILKGSQYAGMAVVTGSLVLYQYIEYRRRAVAA